jgi:hypothetical protein
LNNIVPTIYYREEWQSIGVAPFSKGEIMMVLFVGGIIVGMILGWHFKVLILVPTLVAVAAGIAVLGIADGFSIRETALAGFGTIVALQFGFLGGSALNLRDWNSYPASAQAPPLSIDV